MGSFEVTDDCSRVIIVYDDGERLEVNRGDLMFLNRCGLVMAEIDAVLGGEGRNTAILNAMGWQSDPGPDRQRYDASCRHDLLNELNHLENGTALLHDGRYGGQPGQSVTCSNGSLLALIARCLEIGLHNAEAARLYAEYSRIANELSRLSNDPANW